MKRKDNEHATNRAPVLAAVLAMCALLLFICGGMDIFQTMQKGFAWKEAETAVSLSMVLTCLVCLFFGRFLLIYEERVGKTLLRVRFIALVLLTLAVIIVAVLPIGRSYILITIPSAALVIGALMLWAITGLAVSMLLEKDEE